LFESVIAELWGERITRALREAEGCNLTRPEAIHRLTADARGSEHARALLAFWIKQRLVVLREMTRLAWRYMIETQGEAALSPLMPFVLERALPQPSTPLPTRSANMRTDRPFRRRSTSSGATSWQD